MSDAGYSGVRLAKQLGTSKSTVQQWTSGQNYPGGEFLVELVALLNISAHWLLLGKHYQEPASVTRAREEGKREGWAAAMRQMREAASREPTAKLSAEAVEAIAAEVRAARRRAGKGRKVG